MASHIVAPGALPSGSFQAHAGEPSLDTVVVGLIPTIERDYEHRRVFAGLRARNSTHISGSTAFHFLPLDEAQTVLEDARVRLGQVTRGLLNAYNAHTKSLSGAIEVAKTRRMQFEAPEPNCQHAGSWSKSWRGSKAQFQAIGLGVGLTFPGEPGAKRWMQTRDARGYSARVRRGSQFWRDQFEVGIELPKEVREAAEEAEKKAEAVKREVARIKAMPNTEQGFRDHVSETFWLFVRVVKQYMQPDAGFRFTDEVVDDFVEDMSDVFHALKSADTEGRAPVARLQLVYSAQAKADGPLQAFLAVQRAQALAQS